VFSLLAALCFTRSSYQIVLPLLALGLTLALFTGRERRRAILVGAAVPLLLVAALYVKNWVLFGVPTTSSWMGMNLMQVAFYGMSAEDQQELLHRGILSPISRINPFEPLEAYEGIVPPARPRGVPVLDEPTKPSSGVPNFNNVEYVTISRRYQRDFFDLLVHRPDIYWRGVRIGISNTLTPSSEFYFFLRNRQHIERWENVFDRGVLWQLHRRGDESHPHGTAWGIVVGYVAALCFGAVELIRVLRRRGGSPTVAFVWLLLAYTTAVMTLGEVAENQRLRFVADPLALALVAALAVRLVPWLRGARGGLGAGRPRAA
jgi:hypothetical protein